MDDLCAACLCTGRNLSLIGDTNVYQLYSQILNEIPVYGMSQFTIRICWECKAKLCRFDTFKAQVKRSYSELLLYVEQNSSRPSCQPHLQVHTLQPLSIPLGMEVKEEEDLKEEYDCLDHNQLETFVNDLPEASKDKPKNKLKKRKEDIKKKKVKYKKQDSNLDPSDSEPPDYHERQEPAHEEKMTSDGGAGGGERLREESAHDDAQADGDNDKCKEKKRKQEDINKKVRHKQQGSNLDPSDPEPPDYPERQESLHEEKVCRDEGGDGEDIVHDDVPAEGDNDKSPTAGIGEVEKELRDLPSRPQCVECGKVFSSKKTFRYHWNVLHKGQNKYPCPRCGKVYQWKSNLGRHLRSHKAVDLDELYCATCDKRFASIATYKQHLRISRRHVSESEFTFMCNECGKKFVNKTGLRDHIDWEHLKKIKFRCQLCSKPFKCRPSLYIHMQNVHRDKDKKDNLCHVCGKSYQNSAKLKYHIVAMHTSDTPYQCPQCSAAFGWYSSLYRHVREVHYKMKLQHKKTKKQKKDALLPPLQHFLPLS